LPSASKPQGSLHNAKPHVDGAAHQQGGESSLRRTAEWMFWRIFKQNHSLALAAPSSSRVAQ